MHQPVNGSSGDRRVFKDLLSFRKRQINGNHRTTAFVAIGRQRKEHLHLQTALLIRFARNQQSIDNIHAWWAYEVA
jgi:hypothetical protein